MHQAVKYLDKSVLTRHYKRHDKETSKVFTVNKVHLQNQQIQLRFNQLKDGVPPQRTISKSYILVYQFVSLYKLYKCVFL